MCKLDAVARTAGKTSVGENKEKALWCLQAVLDSILNGCAGASDYSVRNLTGKGAGNRGALHLFLYKRDLLQHLLFALLPKVMIPDDAKSVIRRTLGSFEMYRRYMGYVNDVRQDLSWLSVLSPASQAVLQLFEAGAPSLSIACTLRLTVWRLC